MRRFESQAGFFVGAGFESGTCYLITGDKSTIDLLSTNFTIAVAMAENPDLDIALLTDQRTSDFVGTRAKVS
ncbi:MAG: hypothetical protein CMI18_07470 [Opitutaceae bacterium]|nr:hypothetical protein [Opitutaceae bacterium]|tara:strand:+ start:944 stop:1159 length:216 start_codon:yes stop_codon:yes gene_type:complete